MHRASAPARAYESDAAQVAVGRKYALRVTSAERGAGLEVLNTCPKQPLPAD